MGELDASDDRDSDSVAESVVQTLGVMEIVAEIDGDVVADNDEV